MGDYITNVYRFISMKSASRLSEDETVQMLKLEQLFHNRYLTPEFLHHLIAIYVKAIEAFSGDFKFMRTYFMDKMQFVLSTPQIIKMLEGGGSTIDEIRQTVRMTERPIFAEVPSKKQPQVQKRDDNANSTSASSVSPKLQQNGELKRQGVQQQIGQNLKGGEHEVKHTHHHTREQHHYYHYDESKSNRRGMKIDLNMKVMREVEENIKKIHKEVNDADRKIQVNQEKVKAIQKSQQEILNQRIAKRKKKLRKKSVQIKAETVVLDGEEIQPQPVIKKEELIEAQRELTQAVLKFTVRISEHQRQKQVGAFGKKQGDRVKRARDREQEQILLEQDEQNQISAQNVKMKKKEAVEVAEPREEEEKKSSVPQGRVKTTRRHYDEQNDDL